MVCQLAVGPRPSRQHVVEPVLGNLRREAPGARKDGIDPFQHVRRAQHVVAAPFETGDTGDIAEDGAVRPIGPPGDDGHQLEAEDFQLLETVLVLENVDRFEFHPVGEQEFLGLEAA